MSTILIIILLVLLLGGGGAYYGPRAGWRGPHLRWRQRAVIVSVSVGRVTTKTLESEVGAHPRYSGQQDNGGEKKYEERHSQRLEQYYDEVISQLGQPEALLIFGPGEAKLELKERLSRSKAFSERTVDIETADKLTDPQIVARAKEHFRIDR